MNRIVFLFCEDFCQEQILTRIIDHPATTKQLDFRLVKTGGVRGQNAFVDGYLNRGGAVKSDINIIFRDRDFDYPIIGMPDMIVDKKDNKTSCIIHRVTAENYLLSPEHFSHYLQKTSAVSDMSDVFETAARQISNYSAARHTLGYFRDNFGFRTTWKESSGHLPSNQDLEPAACLEKAWNLIEEKQNKLCPISKKQFQGKFEHFAAIFDDTFFQTQQYLIWFNGKDLAKSISKNLPPNLQLSLDNYYKFAFEHFEYDRFPDLVRFQKYLNDL
jgi:hypothetical protein